MKRYLLSIYQPDGGSPPAEQLETIMKNVNAVNQEMAASGVLVFSDGLHQPETATVLHLKDGQMFVTDGPYVESKEHLGGVYIIDAPDLDAALEWARKVAGAIPLPIEVRPFQGRTKA